LGGPVPKKKKNPSQERPDGVAPGVGPEFKLHVIKRKEKKYVC
jgi:hypothetical protein